MKIYFVLGPVKPRTGRFSSLCVKKALGKSIYPTITTPLEVWTELTQFKKQMIEKKIF